jgi:hypothetical protein
MPPQAIEWITAAAYLICMATTWRRYRQTQAKTLRAVFLVCAAAFLACSLAESCIAIRG